MFGMDDKKEVPSWEEDLDAPHVPLRRPNNVPPSNSNNFNPVLEDSVQSLSLRDKFNSSDSKRTTPIQSKLSAEAKEWFPAGYKRPSAQDRLLKFRQNSQDTKGDSEIIETNGICLSETSEHSFITLEIQEFINVLIDDPGQFDTVLVRFLEALTPFYSDISTLDDIAKLIFSEAVAEPNFRYSAARLCRILEEQSPLFRSALHLFAGNLIEQTSSECECNLALTLAELFAQSNCDNLYGNFVLQSIEKIVSVATPDNIKCVCQVLKLTGAALDIHHGMRMDVIFDQLKRVQPSLPTLKNLIEYVVSLRTSNWGQTDINTYSINGDRHSSTHLDGPIFYGPDGKELSEEEKQFLSENYFELFSDDLLDSDPDELFDPDNEMDEEVHAAFREFTKANRE